MAIRATASQPTESWAYNHCCTTNLDANTAARTSVATEKARRDALSPRQCRPLPVTPCQITPTSGQPIATDVAKIRAATRLVQMPTRKKPLAEPIW